MSEFTVQGDFGELRIETEMIDVTSGLPKPDPNWTYTDQHGHQHRYDDGYPTLVRMIDSAYIDEDGWNVEDGHLECPECGEHIIPGTIGPSGFREMAPGRMQAFLNGEPISKERFEELAEAYGLRP